MKTEIPTKAGLCCSGLIVFALAFQAGQMSRAHGMDSFK
jgi:hypothetical protein